MKQFGQLPNISCNTRICLGALAVATLNPVSFVCSQAREDRACFGSSRCHGTQGRAGTHRAHAATLLKPMVFLAQQADGDAFERVLASVNCHLSIMREVCVGESSPPQFHRYSHRHRRFADDPSSSRLLLERKLRFDAPLVDECVCVEAVSGPRVAHLSLRCRFLKAFEMHIAGENQFHRLLSPTVSRKQRCALSGCACALSPRVALVRSGSGAPQDSLIRLLLGVGLVCLLRLLTLRAACACDRAGAAAGAHREDPAREAA